MYILTITAKRKGARRHIVYKNSSIDELKLRANNLNDKYIIEIYTGSWKLVERIK